MWQWASLAGRVARSSLRLSRPVGLLDDNDLAATPTVVADHRGVQLRPFLPALARMPRTVQGRWSAWRTRLRRDDVLPETFADALHAVAAFADPVISGATVGQAWAPHSRTWQ